MIIARRYANPNDRDSWLQLGLGLDLSGLCITGGTLWLIGHSGGLEYSRSGFRWQSS